MKLLDIYSTKSILGIYLFSGKRGRPRKTESSPTKKQKCQDDNEDDSDVDIVDIPEDFVEAPSLRKRRQAQRGKDRRKLDAAKRHKEAVRKLTQIFRKPASERTGAEKKFLTAQTARAINEAKKRNNVKQTIDDRYITFITAYQIFSLCYLNL